MKSDKKPETIPYNPLRTYKGKGWNGWDDFLGTEVLHNKNRKFRSFNEAREFAHSLSLGKRADWTEYTKYNELPFDIPVGVYGVYKDKGWKGWKDFLGNE